MEKSILVNGKSFIVREIKAIDFDDINWDDKKEALKKQIILSTQMSHEVYNELTIKERLSIISAINEVNGFNDFQDPTK